MARKKVELTEEQLPALLDQAKLGKSDRKDLEARFKIYSDAIANWKTKLTELKVTKVTEVEKMAESKILLADVKAKYKEVEQTRVALGEEAKNKKAAIDAIGKFFKNQLEPIINELVENAEFAKRAEENSLNAIGEQRWAEVEKFGVSIERRVLATMLPDVFEHYKKTCQENWERAEAEKKSNEEKAKLEAEKAKLEAEESRRKAEELAQQVAKLNQELAEKAAQNNIPIPPVSAQPAKGIGPVDKYEGFVNLTTNSSDKDKLQAFYRKFDELTDLPVVHEISAMDMLETALEKIEEAKIIIKTYYENEFNCSITDEA